MISAIDWCDWCLRLVLAALCGATIGFERKRKSKEVGAKTHILIAVGAALVMVVSKYGFFDLLRFTHANWAVDPSRIAAQVVSGIGFLGAGTIMNRRNRVIDGLTTAAGIWVTGAIGLACGSGLLIMGIAGTVCVLGAEKLGNAVDRLADRHHHQVVIFVRFAGTIAEIENLVNNLDQSCFQKPASYTLYGYDGQSLGLRIYGQMRHNITVNDVFRELMSISQVTLVEID